MKRRYNIRVIVFSICMSSLLTCIAYFCSPLPDVLTQQPYSTLVVDNNNNLLAATIATDQQWRFPPPRQLPQKYITAVIAFEDKRFYLHSGVDPFAIARAFVTNIKNGRIVSGGSTLTMQLARQLRGRHARSYFAKAAEAMLALKLEFHLDKQEILKYYATFAPFGGNTVGIDAANWRYFGHRLEDISWAEAALLAVLPNNPSGIHPGKNRATLVNKRNHLLKKLAETGYLSELDLKLTMLEPLPDKPAPLPDDAGHLLATLKKRFPQQFKFVTAIDRQLQKHLYAVADSYGRKYEKNNIHNISILVLANDSHEVIGYIGNQARGDQQEYAADVDIIQRPRSSGSLFKPFLFALMLQQGDILPDSLIPDIPSYYDGYSPENYDRHYRGLVPAREALSQSLNVPAVRLLYQYGVAAFKKDLQQLGITTLWRPAEDYGLSLILGGAETTLWDITNSFARLMQSAEGSDYSPLRARLHNHESVDFTTYPIAQGAAWQTLEALIDVNRPGVSSGWRNFDSSQRIAWKTGTSYGWHDAWAVGSNGRYTVGVWTGNANGEEARKLSGTRTAAPVMLDVFNYLPRAQWPEKPERALKKYKVCKEDHYLSGNGCETERVDAPVESDFTTVTPYHRLIHVDSVTHQRVHGFCESPSNMLTISQFVIPPVHAYYFSQFNIHWRSPPAWRKDCRDNLPEINNVVPLALEYPGPGSQVKIPVELDGRLGRVVIKAHHNDGGATIYWHLNDRYLDSTQYIHEKAIVVNPGWNQITLVDNKGFKISRWFKAI